MTLLELNTHFCRISIWKLFLLFVFSTRAHLVIQILLPCKKRNFAFLRWLCGTFSTVHATVIRRTGFYCKYTNHSLIGGGSYCRASWGRRRFLKDVRSNVEFIKPVFFCLVLTKGILLKEEGHWQCRRLLYWWCCWLWLHTLWQVSTEKKKHFELNFAFHNKEKMCLKWVLRLQIANSFFILLKPSKYFKSEWEKEMIYSIWIRSFASPKK